MFLTMVFSSILFYAGGEDDSDNAQNVTTSITSIPDAMWFSIITMTTVGYGDVTPSTIFGKIIAAICAVSGIAKHTQNC